MARLSSCIGYFFLFVILRCFRASASSPSHKTAGAALFIFGDSTVDVGNNNYITTTPENRADVKPYGQNGFFEGPTGRFSDGRVIVDYIGIIHAVLVTIFYIFSCCWLNDSELRLPNTADYANLPLIPPFLQPSADYTYGANFASAGGGVLPDTNKGLVSKHSLCLWII